MVNVVYITTAGVKNNMDGRKKKKLHCHFKWKKPFVNDISVILGLNDRLCIRMRNKEYECMAVGEWLEKNPLAVLVENVINKGPSVRHDVYKIFQKKIGNVNLAQERKRYTERPKFSGDSD